MLPICYVTLKKRKKYTHIYFGSEQGLETSIGTHPVNFDTEPSALTDFGVRHPSMSHIV